MHCGFAGPSPDGGWELAMKSLAGTVAITLYLVACVGAGLAIGSCIGCLVNPTHIPENELEIRMVVLVQCFADHMGLGEVETRFYEEPDIRRGAGCGSDNPHEMCHAAGRATPYTRTVEIYGPWLRRERGFYPDEWDYRYVAAHEVCHLSGTWDEGKARECGLRLMEEANCEW